MERINDTLKKLGNNAGFQARFQKMRQDTLQNPSVRAFLVKHEDEITDDMLERSLMTLYDYANQSKNCQECPSLGECKNLMQGYHPQLVIGRGTIDISYDRCPLKVMDEEKRKSEKLIQSMYVPKDIYQASFTDLYDDELGRRDAIKKAVLFVKNYEPGAKQKGLYFYGKFGVGKSFLLGAIANELARKNVSSMIVYFPELLRELKNSIGDSTLNEKIENIKNQPVLMIDDIGAETMSSWTRDEVLGPILQYRMQEYLPTFFSTNFDYEGLEHHLTYSQRGEEEKMKARRVLERIRYLTEPVLVDGPNLRR
ncbi:primosomal protein DnaI [Robertmurraya yapensis]|uniref:Primosomal protein DnaI n=1 Tax=Bacillus yapensis TaxID=2492960 RepID=A0A431W2I0_9BACI|nr:primosomal protein DnaI [Bacillus yapensis]RTR29646.1 primosomal protein DnaI [Bacillus yapensis]TKS94992.1 primosomal protein DnaI [Bacillus yapensis]